MRMKVTLAQINPTVGDLSGNSRKIAGIIQEYSLKCDLIIFPEMCLTGYPPQDLLLDLVFIEKTVEAFFYSDLSLGELPYLCQRHRSGHSKLSRKVLISKG